MMVQVLWMGLVTGIAHFFFMGLAYGNPVVGRIYKEAQEHEQGVKKWSNNKKYLLTQFLGTQGEIFILTLGFVWFAPIVGLQGFSGFLILAAFFALLRVYPRTWNMWIQSTYPNRLLVIETINGILGTVFIALVLYFLPR